MADLPVKYNRNPTANNLGGLIAVPEGAPDGLKDWAAWFFQHVVTTKASSQHEQARGISLFIQFMLKSEKTYERPRWTLGCDNLKSDPPNGQMITEK